MKTKTPISIFLGAFVVIFLLMTGIFWLKITSNNPPQVVDNQSVIVKNTTRNAAILLLRTLPATAP